MQQPFTLLRLSKHPDIHQIKCFLAVARTLNYSKAVGTYMITRKGAPLTSQARSFLAYLKHAAESKQGANTQTGG